MRRLLLCVTTLAGCASLPGNAYYQTGETIATPTQAARIARQVFDGHRIPLKRATDMRNADSGFFDARSVWGAGEIDGVIECGKPKGEPMPGGKITMNVSASAREYRQRNTSRLPVRTRATESVTRVALASAGKREDGAKCKLTPHYAALLLEEIVRLGGQPAGRGMQ